MMRHGVICPGRQVGSEKIFHFVVTPNQIENSRHPVPSRGALAIVTNVGAGRGGRGWRERRAHQLRTVKSCGPDAAVLASSSREANASRGMTVAKEPFTGEITK